jgi:hypothetical protein
MNQPQSRCSSRRVATVAPSAISTSRPTDPRRGPRGPGEAQCAWSSVLRSPRPAQSTVQGAQSTVHRPRTRRFSDGSSRSDPLAADGLPCFLCTQRERSSSGPCVEGDTEVPVTAQQPAAPDSYSLLGANLAYPCGSCDGSTLCVTTPA